VLAADKPNPHRVSEVLIIARAKERKKEKKKRRMQDLRLRGRRSTCFACHGVYRSCAVVQQ
jgi:hypothetical protein